MLKKSTLVLGLLFVISAVVAGPGIRRAPAQAQANCPGGLHKMSFGISVTPPNVIHTPPYVAKALGLFAKHCIDPNIVEFEGGATGTIVSAIAQGGMMANLTDVAIAHGLKAKQVWMLAPRYVQSYAVAPGIRTAADLKGKRLSAAGGGVGGLNWLVGREILKTANLSVNDVQFISQGTAGRLPGLVSGQLEGVLLHPEDLYLAQKQRPGVHALVEMDKLEPKAVFTAYGVSDDTLAKEPTVVRDAIAALIEANRTIYRDKEKVIPIMVQATGKPRDAVEYAYDWETKNCSWSVNGGFDQARTMWTLDDDIANGYVDKDKRLSFDQIVDTKPLQEALKLVGGPTTIHGCKD
jgi:NitT/TauT family transport system substrate-binding protein